MLAAKSISYVDPKAGGTSGIYLDGLFQRMGIADEVKKKAVFGFQGSQVASAVADGKAELGLTFISEMLPNKGVKIAGPLPDAIQSVTNTRLPFRQAAPTPRRRALSSRPCGRNRHGLRSQVQANPASKTLTPTIAARA